MYNNIQGLVFRFMLLRWMNTFKIVKHRSWWWKSLNNSGKKETDLTKSKMYKYYQDLVLGWNYLEEKEILKNGVRLIIEDQIIYSI